MRLLKSDSYKCFLLERLEIDDPRMIHILILLVRTFAPSSLTVVILQENVAIIVHFTFQVNIISFPELLIVKALHNMVIDQFDNLLCIQKSHTTNID